MEKQPIKIDQVITDLTELFNINEESRKEFGTLIHNKKFYINKQQFERLEVISMLQEYFKNKYVDGGYIHVDGITMVHTTFEIMEGAPE